MAIFLQIFQKFHYFRAHLNVHIWTYNRIIIQITELPLKSHKHQNNMVDSPGTPVRNRRAQMFQINLVFCKRRKQRHHLFPKIIIYNHLFRVFLFNFPCQIILWKPQNTFVGFSSVPHAVYIRGIQFYIAPVTHIIEKPAAMLINLKQILQILRFWKGNYHPAVRR